MSFSSFLSGYIFLYFVRIYFPLFCQYIYIFLYLIRIYIFLYLVRIYFPLFCQNIFSSVLSEYILLYFVRIYIPLYLSGYIYFSVYLSGSISSIFVRIYFLLVNLNPSWWVDTEEGWMVPQVPPTNSMGRPNLGQTTTSSGTEIVHLPE